MNDTLTWCLIALLLACLAGGMLLYDQLGEGQPPEGGAVFQGRPVQAWLDDLGSRDRHTSQEALEVLGMMGPANEDAVPELARALQNPDTLVRAGAARALGRIGPAARPALAALESSGESALGVDGREILEARGRIEGRVKMRDALAAGIEDR